MNIGTKEPVIIREKEAPSLQDLRRYIIVGTSAGSFFGEPQRQGDRVKLTNAYHYLESLEVHPQHGMRGGRSLAPIGLFESATEIVCTPGFELPLAHMSDSDLEGFRTGIVIAEKVRESLRMRAVGLHTSGRVVDPNGGR